MVGRIRRVLVKHPRQAFVDATRIDSQWRALRFLGPPDLGRAIAEFDALVEILGRAGAEVLFLPRDDTTGLDSIYVCDAAITTDRGLVLAGMGKEGRRAEPEALGRFCRDAGLPVAGRIAGGGRLEGGDAVWIDARTLAVGQGHRSDAEGVRQLRVLLGDLVDGIVPVPLPHWKGRDDVLHLMSLLSPIDRDLLLVHRRLLPVPFLDLLRERGFTLLDVPEDEYERMGGNVLALAPRLCLALEGNPRTRAALERAGAGVLTYSGREISLKGSGGPTCLVRTLLREKPEESERPALTG
jgi:N-dimethylarginine dimethylaminohydrolase